MGKGIFIAYRRSDTIHIARRIFDAWNQQFPDCSVFHDENSIPPGARFRLTIPEFISGNCRALVVLIGPNWVEAKNKSGTRRLLLPDDVHRQEVEAGLNNPNIHVYPVIVGNTISPSKADLPESLNELFDFNFFRIREEDPYFHRDLELLTIQIEADFKQEVDNENDSDGGIFENEVRRENEGESPKEGSDLAGITPRATFLLSVFLILIVGFSIYLVSGWTTSFRDGVVKDKQNPETKDSTKPTPKDGSSETVEPDKDAEPPKDGPITARFVDGLWRGRAFFSEDQPDGVVQIRLLLKHEIHTKVVVGLTMLGKESTATVKGYCVMNSAGVSKVVFDNPSVISSHIADVALEINSSKGVVSSILLRGIWRKNVEAKWLSWNAELTSDTTIHD